GHGDFAFADTGSVRRALASRRDQCAGSGRATRDRQGRLREAASSVEDPGLLLFLEYEPVVLEQLPLEADLVGAYTGGEREPEIGAGEPARKELKLEQRLSETGRADPPVPLDDCFDVVEPAACACEQAEVRLGAADELLLTMGKPRAGKLAPQEREHPRIGVSWREPAQRVDVDLFRRNHVGSPDHRLDV